MSKTETGFALTATNADTSSIWLEWHQCPGGLPHPLAKDGSVWELAWREVGTDDWWNVTIPNINSDHMVDNLKAGKAYEFNLRLVNDYDGSLIAECENITMRTVSIPTAPQPAKLAAV